jgi:hypothetical protein
MAYKLERIRGHALPFGMWEKHPSMSQSLVDRGCPQFRLEHGLPKRITVSVSEMAKTLPAGYRYLRSWGYHQLP